MPVVVLYAVMGMRPVIKPYLRHGFRSDTFPGISCQATFGQSLRDGCAGRVFPGISCRATFGSPYGIESNRPSFAKKSAPLLALNSFSHAHRFRYLYL